MTHLSPNVAAFRDRVEDEAAFLKTCEGGEHGSPDNRSIWLLGIEPGWSLADEAADREIEGERAAKLETYAVELQLEWPFSRNAFKQLCALEGGGPEDFYAFAQRARPFERDSTGYSKASIFPEPCNKVGELDAHSAAKTGFARKDDYCAWLRENRFRVTKSWIERCRPRLVIGSGLTHLADFLEITGATRTPSVHTITVNGHAKRLHVATNGMVPVAVILT